MTRRDIIYILLVFLLFFVLIKPSGDQLSLILDVVTDVFIVTVFFLLFRMKNTFRYLLGLFLSVVVLNMDIVALWLLVKEIELVNSGFYMVKRVLNYTTIPLFAIGFVPLFVDGFINIKSGINIRVLLGFLIGSTLLFQIAIVKIVL